MGCRAGAVPSGLALAAVGAAGSGRRRPQVLEVGRVGQDGSAATPSPAGQSRHGGAESRLHGVEQRAVSLVRVVVRPTSIRSGSIDPGSSMASRSMASSRSGNVPAAVAASIAAPGRGRLRGRQHANGRPSDIRLHRSHNGLRAPPPTTRISSPRDPAHRIGRRCRGGRSAALEQRTEQMRQAVVERQAGVHATRLVVPARRRRARQRRQERHAVVTGRVRIGLGVAAPSGERHADLRRGTSATLPPDTKPGFSMSQTRGSACPWVSTRPVGSIAGMPAADHDRLGRPGDVHHDARPDRAGAKRGSVLVAGPGHHPGPNGQADGFRGPRQDRANDRCAGSIRPSRLGSMSHSSSNRVDHPPAPML